MPRSLVGIVIRCRGLRDALRREEAATAVEYALMVALIAVVIFGAVFALGNGVNDLFDDVANTFP